MPSMRMAPASKKFAANEPVYSKMNPAAIGATIPARLLKKFMMLPTVPTVPLEAINPGMLQPLGASNARPTSAMEIQMIATLASVVKAAPITAIPNTRAAVRSILRTLVAS